MLRRPHTPDTPDTPGMRRSSGRPRRLRRAVALAAVLALLVPLAAPAAAQTPPQDTPAADVLSVEAKADETEVPIGEAVTLSAEIANAPAGQTAGYLWEMSYGGGFWFTLDSTPQASYLSSSAETVTFRVTVTYGSGESAASEPLEVSFVVPTPDTTSVTTPDTTATPDPPAKPSGLTATATAGSLNVTLDWDDTAGADDYLVRWRPAEPGSDLNAGVEVTASAATVTVAAVGAYVVRVQACNDGGCGLPAATRVEVEPAAAQEPNQASGDDDPAQDDGADEQPGDDEPADDDPADEEDAQQAPPAPTGLSAQAVTPPAQQPQGHNAALRSNTPAVDPLKVAVDWDDTARADTYLVRWREAIPTSTLNAGVETSSSEATITVDDVGDWIVRVQACNKIGCGPAAAATVAADSLRALRSELPVSGDQDTPSPPALCGADPASPADWFASVASTKTSITVTLANPLPTRSSTGPWQLQFCRVSAVASDARSSFAGTQFTAGEELTLVGEGSSNSGRGLVPGTDYWVRLADFGSGGTHSAWQHIKTAGTTPTLPSGCPTVGTVISQWSAVRKLVADETSVAVDSPSFWGSGANPPVPDKMQVCKGDGSVATVVSSPSASTSYTISRLGTATTDPVLTKDTSYWFRFHAAGPPERRSDWLLVHTAGTAEPTVPEFTDGTAKTLTVASGATGGTVVGSVPATDADGDVLTYALTGGNASSFRIDQAGNVTVGSGVTLSTVGSSFNFQATVTDGEDASGNPETGAKTIDDSINVTVNVVAAQVPGVPAGLTVTQTSLGGSLDVSWTAGPTTGGNAVWDYDIRFYAGTADPDPATDWIEAHEINLGGHDHIGTASEATIKGLKASTAYRVQVRASNSAGTSAWSTSATATTIAAAATNNAPRVIKQKADKTGCEVVASPADKVTITRLSAVASGSSVFFYLGHRLRETSVFPNRCVFTNDIAAQIDDQDADELSFTWEFDDLPNNVVFERSPVIHRAVDGRHFVRFQAGAARANTNIDLDVTATDTHGESVSTIIRFVLQPFEAEQSHTVRNTSAPTFASAASSQVVVKDAAITTPLVLPTATGGDLVVTDLGGDPVEPYRFPYHYTVTGLPAGLEFDSATRTISGTPTAAFGTYEVTYTVDDADTITTEADQDSQTFKIVVSDSTAVAIESVEITSVPSIDVDQDGVGDTYGVGEDIEVTVTWTDTVTWKDTSSGNSTIRVQLGGVGNSVVNALLVRDGATTGTARSLVFRYTVQSADVNASGIDVKQNTAPSMANDVVIKQALDELKNGGADVSLRHAALAANTAHKTNGGLAPDRSAPYPVGMSVSGTTVTVTFNEALKFDSVPPTSAFSVTVAGSAAAFSGVTVNNSNKKLFNITLLAAPQAADSVTVSYTKPTEDALRDGGGNEVASFGPISKAADHDADNDTLIEVTTAAQLNALRWDLNGDGAADAGLGTAAKVRYLEAFNPVADQCDNPSTTGTTETCTGYELANDIDLNVAPFNTGAGWVPIGSAAAFAASFNGRNFTISNLMIDRSAETNPLDSGLFGRLSGRVQNLGLADVDITAGGFSGALVGNCLNMCAIAGVWATGSVTAVRQAAQVGGLVGQINGATGSVQLLASAVEVSGSGTDPGGTAISGHTRFGGLVGYVGARRLNDAYAVGSVSVAGSSVSSVGGLVGLMTGSATVDKAYSIGKVTAPSGATAVGGLAGTVTSPATVTNSYWDTTSSGQSSSAGGTGKTTAELQAGTHTAGSGQPFNGWANGTWNFGTSSQYPVLIGFPLTAPEQRELFADIVLTVDADTGTTGTQTAIGEGGGAKTMRVTATLASGTAAANTTVTLSFSGTAGRGATGDYTTTGTLSVVISSGASSGTRDITVTPVDDLLVEGTETIVINGSSGDLKVASASVGLTDNDAYTDYDTDDDGLIEIDTATKLNAIRWDLDGDGAADNTSDNASYQAVGAFRIPAVNQCDKASTMGTTETCTGYELTADIALSGAAFTHGEGWEPIGSASAGWAATFDGDGHRISSLSIGRAPSGVYPVGLFGVIASGGTVEDVRLGVNRVTGRAEVGALAGRNAGTVQRVFVGGGTVSALWHEVGGLVGDNTGTIRRSGSRADVEQTVVGGGRGIAGGLVGLNRGLVSDSYAAGPVSSGGSEVGGLVGRNNTGTGNANDAGKGITNSYAAGSVSSTSGGAAGGLVGSSHGGAATASYWDTSATGQSASVLGTGLTTLAMQAPTAPGAATGDTYHGWAAATWDFGNQGQYPVLKGMPVDSALQRNESFTLSVSPSSISEPSGGSQDVTVTATLVGGATAPAGGVTVSLSLDGTATGGGVDYTPDAAVETITIAAGSSSGNVLWTFAVIDDDDWEPDETIIVRGTNAFAGVAPAVITLTSDDDPAITLSSTTTSIAEDASGTVSVTLNAALQQAPAANSTLTLSFGGTATKDTDYTVTPTTISITAGSKTASATLTFGPTDNPNRNGDKTIVIGGTLSGYQVVTHTIKLTDDEPIPITLSLSPAKAAENVMGNAQGNVAVTVTATLTEGALAANTSITLDDIVTGSGKGTAVAGTDYAAIAAKTLVIPANMASASTTAANHILINPTDDATDENNETIVIGGTASGFSVTPATFTIEDNDGPSDTIDITVDTSSAAGTQTSIGEEAGQTTVTIKAALNKGARLTDTVVTLAYGSTGTAERGTGKDFTGPASLGTITIAANSTSGTTTAVITPETDVVDEGDTTIVITGTETVTEITTVNSATITITDDDAAPTAIDLSFSPASIAEDADGDPMDSNNVAVKVVATWKGRTTRAEDTVVNLATSLGGTACKDTTAPCTAKDYDASGLPTSVTIAAKAASGEATGLKIDPVDDTDSEGTETITLGGSACKDDSNPCTDAYTVNGATLRLTDDDLPVVTLSVDTDPGPGTSTALAEGANRTNVRVTASRETAVNSAEVTVSVTVGAAGSTATRGATKDYTGTATVSIRIPANTASATATIWIDPHQDRFDEGDGTEGDPYDTIIIGGDAGTAFSVDAAVITITDDDAPSTAIALSVNRTAALAETAGPTAVTVTAEWVDAVVDSETVVTLSLAGTATRADTDPPEAGDDYTHTGTLSITIPANTVSATTVIHIDPIDDRIDESDGTAARRHEDIVVNGSTTDATISVRFSSSIAITDNDTVNKTITLSVDDASIGEGETSATAITITASLSGTVTYGDDIVVDITAELGGNATLDTDYNSTALPNKVTIPAESSSGEAAATFSITPIEDSTTEGDETIIVNGSVDDTFTVNGATIELVDNDQPSTSLTISVDTDPGMGTSTALAEPASNTTTSVTVTATLNAGTRSGPTTVRLSLSGTAERGAGKDYTAPAALTDTTVDLTIAADSLSASKTFDFTVLADTIDESDGTNARPDETIIVGGTASSAGVANFGVTAATITITDDDTASTMIALSANPTQVREADGGTAKAVSITATLSGTVSRSTATVVALSFDDTNGTAANTTDYTRSGLPASVRIPAGSLSGTATGLSITPVDDRIAESDETIIVKGTLSGFTVSSASIALKDNDQPSTSLTVTVDTDTGRTGNQTALAESAGATSVKITAELDAGTRAADTVLTLSLGGTACKDTTSPCTAADYSHTTLGTITISAGSLSASTTVTFTPVPDTFDEGASETITVGGTADSGGTDITVTARDITLTDDDTLTKTIRLSTSPASVNEDDTSATAITITATLASTGTSVDAITVNLEGALGGTATAGTGGDYTHTYASLTPKTITITAGSHSASAASKFSVTPLQDTESEGTETITVSGSTAATLGFTVRAATLSLFDDDLPPLAPSGRRPEVVKELVVSGPAHDLDGNGAGDTYGLGEKIQVTLFWNRPVRVTGSPRIQISSDRGYKWANYESGSGTRALTFAYTVAAGDLSVGGVAVRGWSLQTNGGSIRGVRDDGSLSAWWWTSLGHQGLPASADHRMNGLTRGPMVTGADPEASSARIVSSPSFDANRDGVRDTYLAGETVRVQVEFNQSVRVDTTGGSPRVRIKLNPNGQAWANYEGGSGTYRLVFSYVVSAKAPDARWGGDESPAGIEVLANTLQFNGSTMASTLDGTAVTAAGLAHSGLGANARHRVDTDLCHRTPGVRDAIVAETGRADCAAVSDWDLWEITDLDVEYNHDLTSVKVGDFDKLYNLQWFSMKGNRLSTLPAGIFDKNTRLRTISLAHNGLTSVPAGLFDNHANLRGVALCWNDLASLPAGLFDNNPRITDLQLQGNELTTLPAELFDNLANLDWLRLHDNDITTLPDGIFGRLGNLQYLYLDNNDLDRWQRGGGAIAANLFTGLGRLKRLTLDYNQLSAHSLPDNVFAPLTSLTELEISKNFGHPFNRTRLGIRPQATIK